MLEEEAARVDRAGEAPHIRAPCSASMLRRSAAAPARWHTVPNSVYGWPLSHNILGTPPHTLRTVRWRTHAKGGPGLGAAIGSHLDVSEIHSPFTSAPESADTNRARHGGCESSARTTHKAIPVSGMNPKPKLLPAQFSGLYSHTHNHLRPPLSSLYIGTLACSTLIDCYNVKYHHI